MCDLQQSILAGLVLGVLLGCLIIVAMAWKRGWWQGMTKPKV